MGRQESHEEIAYIFLTISHCWKYLHLKKKKAWKSSEAKKKIILSHFQENYFGAFHALVFEQGFSPLASEGRGVLFLSFKNVFCVFSGPSKEPAQEGS